MSSEDDQRSLSLPSWFWWVLAGFFTATCFNSTLSPGSHGLPPDASVMQQTPGSCCHWTPSSYSGAWGSTPPGLTFQNQLSSFCILGTRQCLLLFSPSSYSSSPRFQKTLLSPVPSWSICFWSIPVPDHLFSSPHDAEGGEPRW
uniref:Uncharacterized protein n=1 Tax=Theropithecus gelada TaxID=9565 RepID=A0A8D2E713_THEGE